MFASQDNSLDQKVITLWKLYADNHQVATSLRDVEQIRTSAQNVGIAASVAAFGLNEVARLLLRSPIFKLKLQNIAFFAVAPSLFARYSYQSAINDRVDSLWRIHENRERKGMGGTKNAHNLYHEDQHTQDRGFRIQTGLHMSMDAIVTGENDYPMLNNPFTRYHKSIEEYPQEHGNLDDEKLYTTDNFERLKPQMPKQGSVVGETTIIPQMDTDEKLIFYDTQGESLYSNPPDPNVPVVDHGLDELSIWSFRKTNYNQKTIYNAYTRDVFSAFKEHNAPWWGIKLSTPAFYKREKLTKFLNQYAIRLDFESLKARHARELVPGDMAQRDQHKAEVAQFLADADRKMLEAELGDLHITDHKPKVRQFSTLNEEEDAEYFNYVQSLADYNRSVPAPNRQSQFSSGRFEKGSFLQRMLEPLAGARKLDNGTLYYEVSEKEIERQMGSDSLREKYEKAKNFQPLEGEEEEEVRVAMFDAITEAGYDIEEWDKILAREFDTFADGEKYDYVKDLRRTFDQSVSTPAALKIFKKLPAHVFWDIKKPQTPKHEFYLNPFNPSRKYPYANFFEMRSHEDWIAEREQLRKLNPSVSRYYKN